MKIEGHASKTTKRVQQLILKATTAAEELWLTAFANAWLDKQVDCITYMSGMTDHTIAGNKEFDPNDEEGEEWKRGS